MSKEAEDKEGDFSSQSAQGGMSPVIERYYP